MDTSPATTTAAVTDTNRDAGRDTPHDTSGVPWHLLTALVATIPCFWPPRIVVGDLPSHVYLASLVPQIRAGALPGLILVPQRTNVLADWILEFLVPRAGAFAAERIVAALTVFLFVFGASRLIARTSERSALWLSPLLLVLAYSFSFQYGFTNFQLSTGLALILLSSLLRPRWPHVPLYLSLIGLAWFANPLPLAWAGGCAILYCLVRASRASVGAGWTAVGGVVLVIIDWVLRAHVRHEDFYVGPIVNAGPGIAYIDVGKYIWCAYGILVVATRCGMQLIRERGGDRASLRASLSMYFLTVIAGAIFPYAVYLYGNPIPLSFLTERWSLLACVLLLALIAQARPPRWLVALAALVAVAFFTMLYQDQRLQNDRFAQIQALVQQLPPGQTVIDVGSLHTPGPLTVPHMLGLACIEHCYDFGNYEPQTGHFRVRVQGPNPYAVWRDAKQWQEQAPKDRSLFAIHDCATDASRLCLGLLRPAQ